MPSKYVLEFMVILTDVSGDDAEAVESIAEDVASRIPLLHDIVTQCNTLRIQINRNCPKKQHLDDIVGNYLHSFKDVANAVGMLNIRATVKYNPHSIVTVPQ